MANALILHGLFAEFPTQFLQGILEPNLIPSREFESRSREFGALPEIPIRRDVGRRMGTSATRIYAPISITNPPASLAPPFGFLAKDAELSLQSPQSPQYCALPATKSSQAMAVWRTLAASRRSHPHQASSPFACAGG